MSVLNLDRFKENKHFIVKDMGYSSPCYIWLMGKEKGYACATISIAYKVRIRVHKYLYQLKYGKVPDGMNLHHKCRNRDCINIEHLQPLTYAEHNRDKDRVKYKHTGIYYKSRL